jgi:tetratricopeptide (TPR) repeat protein
VGRRDRLDRSCERRHAGPSRGRDRAREPARRRRPDRRRCRGHDGAARTADEDRQRRQAGVASPAQGAFAALALARIDFARGDTNAAVADVSTAAGFHLDDERFAEAAVETLFNIAQTKLGEKAAHSALETFPTSRRVQLALARILAGEGQQRAALDVLAKLGELPPATVALRGHIKLAAGDVDGARADFDAALQKQPNLEPAIVGEAWLDLATNDVEAARKLVEPRVTDKGASPAISIAYAAILRRGDDAAKAKARALLEKLAAGMAGGATPDAELELARVDRDTGDYGDARKMYAVAGQAGNGTARLEGAVMAIDDRDPAGGRETLDTLLKAAGDQPSPELVLETARARMLVGDHEGAASLLETADKLPGIQKWKLAREKGRLYLRRGDVAAAITALSTALDGCGDDTDTFLLAADAATNETTPTLGDKLKKVLAERVKNTPVAQIATGKLLLQAGGKDNEADTAYRTARDTLRAQHAAARLIAQADYGLAVVAYNKSADQIALDELDSVLNGDPSLYDAYLFKADLVKDKKVAYGLAQTAVKYNPDYPRAWSVLGKLAAKNGDKAALANAIEMLQKLAPTSADLNDLKKLR